jgi:hypothetical protein
MTPAQAIQNEIARQEAALMRLKAKAPTPKPSTQKLMAASGTRGQSFDTRLDSIERGLEAYLRSRGLDPKLAARAHAQRTSLERTDPERAAQLEAMDKVMGITSMSHGVRMQGSRQVFGGVVTSAMPVQPRASQVRPARAHTDPERAAQLEAIDKAMGIATRGPAVKFSRTTQTFSALGHTRR